MYAITLAAAELKVVAPEQFSHLVEAFGKLETKLNSDLLAADASVIFGAQGKTWLAAQLRQRLEKCLEQKRNYENRS
jgi:hypothetical protein